MKFIQAKDAQEPYDEEAFGAVLDSTVDELVREQARIGIDIVNEGEFPQTSYANYVRDRLSGFEMQKPGGDIIGALDQVRSGNLVPGSVRARGASFFTMSVGRVVGASRPPVDKEPATVLKTVQRPIRRSPGCSLGTG
jgi:hypothetical protein